MATKVALLCAFLLILSMCLGGLGRQCSMRDITVEQKRTGKVVGGQPEYEVFIRNHCVCPFMNVILNCPRFSSAEPIDPAIFLQIDDKRCILNYGKNISSDHPISFAYAAPTPCNFSVQDSPYYCY